MARQELPTPNVDSLPNAASHVADSKAADISRRRRRNKKLRRFIFLETLALVALTALTVAGISERYADPSLTTFFTGATIVAAFAVVLMPVLFYGLPRSSYGARRIRK